MKYFRRPAVWCLVVLLIFFFVRPVSANEPRVTIKILSEEIKPGDEIIIELTISHSANSYIHFVDWVEILVNQMESSRWTYNPASIPPDQTFTKEYKYKVPDLNRIRIDAEASCIRHGSSGKVTLRVPIKK